MSTLTKSEYENEIKEIAAGIWEEAVAQAEGDTEEAEELTYDLTHDWVDNHQWVIYNVYHKDILSLSENEDAYKDVYCNEDLGSILSEDGFDKLYTLMAYFAIQADISQALHEIKED